MSLQLAKSLMRPKPHDVYWLPQAETEMPAENDWLSDRELLRLEGMRFAKRRADWRLGRWTAKRALATYLNAPFNAHTLADMEILPAADGAPEVFIADQPAAVTISLSHRAGMALCAVTTPGVALGCDLEMIEPHSDAFVADYFTLEEQALVAHASVPNRPSLLALLWSAKESALKALRVGLRVDTRSLVISLDVSTRPDDYPRESAIQPLYDVDRWNALHVRHTNGQVFWGWWQSTVGYVRTIVSAPRCSPPILLGTMTVAHPLLSVS